MADKYQNPILNKSQQKDCDRVDWVGVGLPEQLPGRSEDERKAERK